MSTLFSFKGFVFVSASTAALLLGSASGVYAQTARMELSGKIVEAYTQAVNVSTSGALVGVWLGKPDEMLEITNLRVAVPAAKRTEPVCFSAITRDGEYTARGSVSVPGGLPGILPVASLRQSPYAEDLRQYPSLDFAVSVRWATDCAVAPTAPYIPAVGSVGSSTLVAAINSIHAFSVEAKLVSREGAAIAGDCVSNLSGRSKAFDTRCTFELRSARSSEPWNLQLTRKPRAGPRRIDDFYILLPTP